jgi:hypothetical protein
MEPLLVRLLVRFLVLSLVLPLVLPLMLAVAPPAALADAFGLSSPGQAERYGTSYPDQPQMPNASSTPTAHHRFGQDLGIGSSGLQTEANTAEVMARVQYTPTANPPTQTSQVTAPGTGTPRFHLFSQRMTSAPLLSPTVTASPSLTNMMNPGMHIQGSGAFEPTGVLRPSPFSSVDIPIWHPHQGEGARMQIQIDNPFNHL